MPENEKLPLEANQYEIPSDAWVTIEKIALSIFSGEITNDFKSPENNKTPLEQIIRFTLREQLEKNVPYLSLEILIYYQYQILLESSYSEDEKCFRDIEENCRKVDNEDQKIREIAKAIIRGEITNDQESPINNLTPLEQLINFLFCENLYFTKEGKQIKEQIMRKIEKEIKYLEGGSSLI